MTDRPSGAPERLSYRSAGVDLRAAERAKERIAALVRTTTTENVLSDARAFGGLFRVPGGTANSVLVASTDGVGTKLKVAVRAARHDTVGEDLVNHCVNDILVQGAAPLFFLDYIGIGELEPDTVQAIVEGIVRGCRANGCALLGGETAELPDLYAAGEYDLAGTIVGIVDESRIVDGRSIREGDVVIALGSSGLHTNGYSLARRIVFDRLALDIDDAFPDTDETVGDILLRVHHSYLPALRAPVARGDVRGMAHITGGGLRGNVARILRGALDARIDRSSWEIPHLFRLLQEAGSVADEDMWDTFNMGVGMVVILDPELAASVLAEVEMVGERAWIAGSIQAGTGKVILA